MVRFWGSTPDERFLKLPGTEHFENPIITSTHAVTIRAPASVIWKYVVQIGQNKGGFYSYRWLENLVGCKMPEINEIVPEFQKIKLGDKVYLHPKAPPLKVTSLLPEHVLGLEGWYLALLPRNENETRLIARAYDWRDPKRKAGAIDKIFAGPLFEIAHFVMERKMLLNLKKLAEAQA